MPKKSVVFGIFKELKQLVEKQSGNSIKMLRTEGGGEYTSLEFDKFYKMRSIMHVVVVPYTP